MNGYYDQLVKVLKAHGFELFRQGKGSHEVWHNGVISVAVPFNCKSRHTANGILKQAGIDKKL